MIPDYHRNNMLARLLYTGSGRVFAGSGKRVTYSVGSGKLGKNVILDFGIGCDLGIAEFNVRDVGFCFLIVRENSNIFACN